MATYLVIQAILVLAALVLGVGAGITLLILTDTRRPRGHGSEWM